MQVKSNGPQLGQFSSQPSALWDGKKQTWEEENQDQKTWILTKQLL